MRPTATLLLASLLVACGGDGLRIVDGASGRPLPETAVEIYIDDGVRCVTHPCPTTSRTRSGRTDAAGRLALPETAAGEAVTLYFEGFEPRKLDHRTGTVRIERKQAREPETETIRLRAAFDGPGPDLVIDVENVGDEPFTLVRPRAGRFARYWDWGGWNILLKDERTAFVPEPLPGPYLAATRDDLVTLEPGDRLTERVPVGAWCRVDSGSVSYVAPRMGRVVGKFTARVRWGGMPDHLSPYRAAKTKVASARVRRDPRRPVEP